jgi:plasmid maintenance system antidote protein VapI
MVATVKRRKMGATSPSAVTARQANEAVAAAGPATASMVAALARQLQSWAGSVLGNVGAATDLSLWVAKNKVKAPAAKAVVGKTQSLLRELRETAGLTRDDLNKALELEDRSFMALVEGGQVAGLPFDLILRLAAILGRGDPMTFILQMTRVYNPKMWKTLEALGVGKLFVQAGREREFANIYRGHDAARDLSDKDFAAALGFTQAAFETALAFQAKDKRTPKPKDGHHD